MKKILSMVLAGAMVASLAACGSSGSKTTTTAAAGETASSDGAAADAGSASGDWPEAEAPGWRSRQETPCPSASSHLARLHRTACPGSYLIR